MPIEVNRLCSVGFPPAQAKEIKQAIEEGASEGGLQIGTTGSTAMAGNRVPTATIRGGVLLQPAIADLTGTVGTANDAMTAITALAASTLATDFATQKTSLDAVITSLNTKLTEINNNLADLQAKVNAHNAALRAAGVLTA